MPKKKNTGQDSGRVSSEELARRDRITARLVSTCEKSELYALAEAIEFGSHFSRDLVVTSDGVRPS
jgi:hypothetical protein